MKTTMINAAAKPGMSAGCGNPNCNCVVCTCEVCTCGTAGKNCDNVCSCGS